jgi:RIO kinase 1
MPQARVIPSWVITDDCEDEELGTIRAGKEAGCFLVRRTNGDRYCLLVRKDYRKRSDRTYSAPVRAGERGIRRDAYEGELVFTAPPAGASSFTDERARRAIAKRTNFGRRLREGMWAGREFVTLRRLWEAGASVPYPVEAADHAFLMQYVGTIGAAAPRLSDLRLERDAAAAIFERLIDELHVFVQEGIVHGDLSAYNVLVQHARPWIIDLPQAVDLFEHPHGRHLFARDVANICRHFERRGVRRDADVLTRQLLEG